MDDKVSKVNNKSKRLEKEPVLKLLFFLSVPSMISMLVNSLYNIIDSIYIGHFSTDGLSALSLAFPIQLILISISSGLGIATSSLISRLLGEKKKEKVFETMSFVTTFIIFYSLLVAIIGLFFSNFLISLFTNNKTLIDMGGNYLKIIMIGNLFMVLPMVYNSFLRGFGDTFNPMITMLIGAFSNILLDPFFIFGLLFFPEMGVKGAALATVISRILSSIYILIIIIKNKFNIKIRFKLPEVRIIKDLFRISIPATFMMFLTSVMFLFVNKIVIIFSNPLGIAVLGLYFRLQTLFLMPIMGLSQGLQPIIGYNYGSKNFKRVKKALFYGVEFSLLISLIAFVFFWLFPTFLIKLFSNDPNLINIGEVALKRVSLAFPFMAFSMIISRSFQSIGRGSPSFIISLFRQIIILVPVFYLLIKFYDLNIAWFAFPIAEFITFFVSLIWFLVVFRKEGILGNV